MKTEKEKMISGEPYNAMDSQLAKERLHAKQRLYEFNHSLPEKIKHRKNILKDLFGNTNGAFYLEPPFHCDYGYNIEIGENFYANYNLVILDCARVKIGNNVLLAPDVGIYTAGHPIHPDIRNTGYEYAFPISIGNNVWIGGKTILNPGVSIGDNCVIGGGSVVTKDIPENTIAVGNPCKVLRTLTEEDKKYFYKNKIFNPKA